MSDFQDKFQDKNMSADLPREQGNSNFTEKLVTLGRVTKVVKGGRRFSFSALVVIGDKNGKVGLGFGKANEVSDAITKAANDGKKTIKKIVLTKKKTIPHEIIGKFKGSIVVMRPAAPGTGVIAGGAVRSVMEVVGVTDVLAKVLGSKNKTNVTKACLEGLYALKNIKDIAKKRDKSITELF